MRQLRPVAAGEDEGLPVRDGELLHVSHECVRHGFGHRDRSSAGVGVGRPSRLDSTGANGGVSDVDEAVRVVDVS